MADWTVLPDDALDRFLAEARRRKSEWRRVLDDLEKRSAAASNQYGEATAEVFELAQEVARRGRTADRG